MNLFRMSRMAIFAFVVMTPMLSQGAHVLWSNDFENGIGAVVVPASGVNHNTLSHGVDPTNAFNGVGIVMDRGTAATGTEWGEIRHDANSYFELGPRNITAGVDTSNFSMRVYIPSTSVVSSNDQINLILRYSNKAMPSTSEFSTNNHGGVSMSSLARDTWHTISWTNVEVKPYAEAVPGEGPTSLYITPILIFSDYASAGSYNAAGVFAYFDDILLVTTPEPSKMLFCFAGLMALVMKRRRR